MTANNVKIAAAEVGQITAQLIIANFVYLGAARATPPGSNRQGVAGQSAAV